MYQERESRLWYKGRSRGQRRLLTEQKAAGACPENTAAALGKPNRHEGRARKGLRAPRL